MVDYNDARREEFFYGIEVPESQSQSQFDEELRRVVDTATLRMSTSTNTNTEISLYVNCVVGRTQEGGSTLCVLTVSWK